MLCENCTKGFQLTGTPTGAIQPDGSYFAARPADSEAPTTSAVVLFTDIFGLALKNPKILADQLAETLGVDVWVPDLFDGKPILKAEELDPYLDPIPGQKHLIFHYFSGIPLLLRLLPGLYANRASVADARVKIFLEKIRHERGYTTVGAVGYCFGGRVAMRFAGSDLVSGAVIAHPGGEDLPAVNAIKVPTLWICAEEDEAFSTKARNAAEAALAARRPNGGPAYEFIDYKGTTHGFACRPALEYPTVKDAFEKSFAKTVEFLDGVVQGTRK